MKKLLFLLLMSVSSFAQVSTGAEQYFDYGIQVAPSSLQVPTTPPYIGTFGTDGTQGKIAPENIPINISPQPINYTIADNKIGTHLKGIDNKLASIPVNYSKIVYVNDVNPNSATIFDLENPPTINDNLLKSDVTNLYIGTDASTWVYNGSIYVTKSVTSGTSNFYLSGTTTDAGNSKTGAIYRTGTFSETFKLTTNPIGSNQHKIEQGMASGGVSDNDYWSIYGASSLVDRGIMVFEVGDNATPIASGGQSFEFRYNNAATGVAKTPLTIDYNYITALANITATSFVRAGTTSTNALLAGGGSLANPISGTGVSGQVSFWNGTATQSGDNGLFWDNTNKRLGVGVPAPVGKMEIGIGSTMSIDLINQTAGSISFGNPSSSAQIPGIIGKSTNNRGLMIIAGTADANGQPDMEFNVRENDGTDFTTLTSTAFRFSVFGTTLVDVLRNGNTTFTGNVTAPAATTANHVVIKSQLDLKANINSQTLTGDPKAPTPTAGDNDTSIATTAFVKANARPYKVYTALLTQTGTNAPVATVLENSLGGTVVWTRSTTGQYLATLSGVFTASKTTITANGQSGTGGVIFNGARGDSSTVQLNSLLYTGALTDHLLSNTTVEIRVYP